MTTTAQRFSARVAELAAERRRFVQATVVRAQCPTSTRPGDAAIVLPDGTIEGFVGGQCAESSVRTAALDALERGESVLLRILPEGTEEFPDAPGAITAVNPCLSGGAIEVFLEPKVPAARVVVVGQTPIAEALASFGTSLGFAIDPVNPAPGDTIRMDGATALVVASHGRAEEATIRAALDTGLRFIGLVASRSRGAAVLDDLGLTDAERRIVRSPVGIDIGARTAEEIALSILAELVRAVRVEGVEAPTSDEPARPTTAVDPVCGMTVTISDDTPHLRHDGTDHWFCNPGCRARFADDLGVVA